MWVAAFINGALAAGTALVFGRTPVEVLGVSTLCFALSFGLLRLLVRSEWYEVMEKHKIERAELLAAIKREQMRPTQAALDVAEESLAYSRLQLLSLPKPRIVVRSGLALNDLTCIELEPGDDRIENARVEAARELARLKR